MREVLYQPKKANITHKEQRSSSKNKNKNGMSYGLYFAYSISQEVQTNKLLLRVMMLDTNDEVRTVDIPIRNTPHWSRISKAYWGVEQLQQNANKFIPRFIRCCSNGRRKELYPVLPDRMTKLANTVLTRYFTVDTTSKIVFVPNNQTQNET